MKEAEQSLVAVNESFERTLQFYKIENEFYRTQTSKKQRNEVRKAKTDMNMQKQLRTVMFDEIFPFYKFIDKDHIRRVDEGSIAMRVMEKLGVDIDKMPEFWAWNHEVAERTFTEYRALAMQAMKREFRKGKCLKMRKLLCIYC